MMSKASKETTRLEQNSTKEAVRWVELLYQAIDSRHDNLYTYIVHLAAEKSVAVGRLSVPSSSTHFLDVPLKRSAWETNKEILRYVMID